MFIYIQKTGELIRDSRVVAFGYSGGNCGQNPEGKNNPGLQDKHCIGPIPAGEWEIQGPPHDHPHLGKYVLRLMPREHTETFGRSDFYIHGDRVDAPGTASEGCVIFDRITRVHIWESGDRCFYVLPERPAMIVNSDAKPDIDGEISV